MHQTSPIPSTRFPSLQSAATNAALGRWTGARLALALMSVAALAGCAVPGSGSVTKPDESSRAVRAEQKSLRERERDPGAPKSAVTSMPAVALPTTAPVAVIRVDPKTGELSEEMERRLRRIAEAAKRDDGVFIRLESYVPSGGSPALDLGRADDNLQQIRERLLRLGVSPRRILLASFGAEYDDKIDHQKAWIEIYLIHTEASVTYESARQDTR